jgi:hypothetical protein
LLIYSEVARNRYRRLQTLDPKSSVLHSRDFTRRGAERGGRRRRVGCRSCFDNELGETVFVFFCFVWSSGGLSLSFQFAQQLVIGRELLVKKLRLFFFFFSMKGEGMAKFVDVSRGLLFLGLLGVGSGCKLEGL